MNEIEVKNEVKSKIGIVPNFPKPGILFYDFFGIFYDPIATEKLVDLVASKIDTEKLDYIVAVESRGFIIGLLLAEKLGKGFVPIRKKGKLPPPTVVSPEFDLEYGKAELEMSDKLKAGDNVVLVDDVLATGGTLKASYDMLKQVGCEVQKVITVLELVALNGREKLENAPFYTVFADTELQ